MTLGSSKKYSFLLDFYKPFDASASIAPVDQVIARIQSASKSAVAQCPKKGNQGPKPDTAIRFFIAELSQIFENKITSGYNEKEVRRVSSFIDFVKAILLALPENAIMGWQGIFSTEV